MLITMALISVIAGMGVPALANLADSFKLGNALRDVERELQTARLKAVTSNRPIRVRFNCPVAGQYRMVELIGTPSAPVTADTATNRCQDTVYPFPPGDLNPLTRPNHDGPLRRLPDTVAFGSAVTLEFWADGSVHKDAGTGTPWPVIPTTGQTTETSITLTRGTDVRRIDINGLGKVTLVR
jgi:hypothetical protein